MRHRISRKSVGALEDLRSEIARLRESVRAERRARELLLGAIDALPNPVFVKDNEGKFVFFNRAYEDFFGVKRGEFVGKSVLDLSYLPEEERERYQREDLRLIEDAATLHYEADYLSAAGEVCPSFYWSRGFVAGRTGEKGLVGEIVDITEERKLADRLQANVEELEKANETIAASARIDALTGVFNRCFLAEKERNFAADVAETQESISFLMFDLDHFKRVNDTFGHQAGDRVLVEFAAILKETCRERGLPIRYGGEEFLLMLYGMELEEAQTLAEEIRAVCARELLRPDGTAITVSIGVAQCQLNENLYQCISRADEALYRAKEAGRNRVMAEV